MKSSVLALFVVAQLMAVAALDLGAMGTPAEARNRKKPGGASRAPLSYMRCDLYPQRPPEGGALVVDQPKRLYVQLRESADADSKRLEFVSSAASFDAYNDEREDGDPPFLRSQFTIHSVKPRLPGVRTFDIKISLGKARGGSDQLVSVAFQTVSLSVSDIPNVGPEFDETLSIKLKAYPEARIKCEQVTLTRDEYSKAQAAANADNEK